jgi:hypothetical protein
MLEDQVIAYAHLCIVTNFPTDAIVYATALAYSANLLTCDAHFE